MVDHVPQLYLMQDVVAQQIEDFVKFPPRQKPASFNLDAVMAQAQQMSHLAAGGKPPQADAAKGTAPAQRETAPAK